MSSIWEKGSVPFFSMGDLTPSPQRDPSPGTELAGLDPLVGRRELDGRGRVTDGLDENERALAQVFRLDRAHAPSGDERDDPEEGLVGAHRANRPAMREDGVDPRNERLEILDGV